ncbi:MAG: hypothetical protein A2252_03825 [Elusimicrobia bacterium RIFOXYA2_FULL_39_19]|nr:MAG: hypothetical protein A2252_03825 [Elusimicrobia bacterium RIFOXYA2_FULL_39_19]
MRELNIVNSGLTDYTTSYELQKKILKDISENNAPDTLILTEHPAVITRGKTIFDKEDILVSQEILKQKAIEVLEIDRGGNITLHCPGQLVGYALLNLEKTQKDIHLFIRNLEEVIIRALGDFKIAGERKEGFTGVWAGNNKIASIGIGVKHWVTYHGFALNVNPDLKVVSMINPCGLKNKKMTSIEEALNQQGDLFSTPTKITVDMKEVKRSVIRHFKDVFAYEELPMVAPQKKEEQKQVLPKWIKKRVSYNQPETTESVIKELDLNTVCNSALCPNINECFTKGTATFMILGNICTRNCGFCGVSKGLPQEIDVKEPEKITQAVKKLNLRHIVITSVTRDDLSDGGAEQFVKVIQEIRNKIPGKVNIELLVPDFKGKKEPLNKIIEAKPDILGHNLETVPRIYKKARAKADYLHSLNLLMYVKKHSSITTKSALMLGLGETHEEVLEVLADLRKVKCDIAVLGQYLQPLPQNLSVEKHITPEEFESYKAEALKMGFKSVVADAFARSSYHAQEAFNGK